MQKPPKENESEIIPFYRVFVECLTYFSAYLYMTNLVQTKIICDYRVLGKICIVQRGRDENDLLHIVVFFCCFFVFET